jgi:alpha-glucosidase (family GH31 glycosyl hydrolase)
MSKIKSLSIIVLLMLYAIIPTGVKAQAIKVNGKPGKIEIREVEENCVRITLKPSGYLPELPYTPTLADNRKYPAPVITLNEISRPVKKLVGNLNIELTPNPLRVKISNKAGKLIQDITFNDDGGFSFTKSKEPILGMGEGGPRPVRGTNWREAPVQFDRNGSYHQMVPRWQSDAYGSRNPVALMIGTEGWALYVATPWGQIDLQKEDKGVFSPQEREAKDIVQNTANQGLSQGKGLPPADSYVKGVLDIFVFDAHNPSVFMKELSLVSGPSVMPPKWALGYMQSHRTLLDESKTIGIVDTFRAKKIPVDAVIYLGSGFCPNGWNKPQPSFEFNPNIFKRKPEEVLADLHQRNVKVVLHIVPWDRDKLPTLHGTIPAAPGEVMDVSHIQNYWQQHVNLMDKGADGFWPDEGDWFNLFERIERHQMYYQGPISTKPNVRPWSLHRNGHLGIAQWGGWVWSGDTESSWKTLEAQIAVGLNHSLSIAPYWGSDIGGFYPNPEKTGELYARWFQFGSFCGSFRSHGRTWFTALPWGWGLSDMGPREDNSRNIPATDTEKRNPSPLEMNNPAIEPITKKYDELHYQLLPYTYTLAWQARDTGMPLMRALWLHYPDDEISRKTGDEYLWGRDMLIAPVYTKGATSRNVYLPKGEWYDWWTNKKEVGGKTVTRQVDLATMPIYVRAGAIIPFDPIRQYTSQVVTEPTTLKVFRGANGQFTLYQDDGISLDYLKGKASWTSLTWNEQEKTLTIAPGAPKGAINQVKTRAFKIQIIPGNESKTVSYSGKPLKVKF